MTNSVLQLNFWVHSTDTHISNTLRGPVAKFVDWRQCAAVMQREAVTVMTICSSGGNVVVT
jgi:hypothetical protein